MTEATQAVLTEALRLDHVERAELIEQLMHSFDREAGERVDALWAREAESRIDAFEAGELTADSIEAVLARIAKQ